MPLHQTPSLQIALLFTVYTPDSEVIMLAGYQWLACEQALHMGYSETCFPKARRRARERRACNGPWMIWVLPPFPLDWSFTSRPHNSAHNYSLRVVQHGNWNKACFWISWIGQSAIYVQNLNVNTQIVQGPLQALLSLAHPLAIWKQKTHTESLFAG